MSKVTVRTWKDFQKEARVFPRDKLWESDINPVYRCLSDNYLGVDSPNLHVAFIDIETNFHQEFGFSSAEEAFNEVTAVTVYLNWSDLCITLALCPKTLSMDTAQLIVEKFENCFLFDDEKKLLNTFLDVIEDADILSGWNSEGYDIPYLVNRVTKILSKDDTRRFCLWDKKPSKRKFERFGAEQETYDLFGRIHLDYMQLYIKYTYHEMHSYSLDAIAEYELDEHKLAYEGSLDQLYNNDFEKFIAYNRQDTILLYKLDTKLKFIDLASEIAHDVGVLLPTTAGIVAVTEQAITLEAHSRGMVVPNRKHGSDEADPDALFNPDQAAGAYVVVPKPGLHRYVGTIDLNSLYPSTIRALNMSPETILGQLRPDATNAMILSNMQDKVVNGKSKKGTSFAEAWDGQFGSLEYQSVMTHEEYTPITIDWENGDVSKHTAKEVWSLIFNNNKAIILSANGTIFTNEKKGIIPGLLERWTLERKALQKKKKEATDKKEIDIWDKKQTVTKLKSNGLYGALLNPGCKFFDQRLGQSTTLTGRCIAKHMDTVVNECITGVADHYGDAILSGDSVAGDSIISSNYGDISVESLFYRCTQFWQEDEKEYGHAADIKVSSYDKTNNTDYFDNISYIHRHKVSKEQWEIEDEDGNTIHVTSDHSVMIERNGVLIEVKPKDLLYSDILLTIG